MAASYHIGRVAGANTVSGVTGLHPGPFAAPSARAVSAAASAGPAFTAPGLTDPEAAQQWHLGKLGGIADVWADYTGKGVRVGIYDTGVEYTHRDLAANYDPSRHVVVDGVTYDGDDRPTSGGHGTSVAGIIAAARNGIGTVGVAYDATLTSVNIFDPVSGGNNQPGIYLNDQKLVYKALEQAAQFDVVNHSWGLSNTTFGQVAWRLDPTSPAYKESETMRIVAERGRDGLGTVSVKSAGNYGVDGQGDPLTTTRHVVAVGAYREADSYAASYSARGAQLLVSAPSSDSVQLGGSGIVTTDLTGRWGDNLRNDPGGDWDYTDYFTGTSAAAPIVTGVAALMLEANDGLGWRDVKDILAASAIAPRGVAAQPGGYQGTDAFVRLNESRFKLAGQDADWNGGAMHYSTDYGYGAVDARAAVRMAEVWSLFGDAKTSANERTVSTPVMAVDLSSVGTGSYDAATRHTDFSGTPVRYTFQVGPDIELEHVDMTLTYSVSFPGRDSRSYISFSDTQLKLIAPDGTEAFVDTTRALIGSSALENSFTFGFSNFRGVESAGTWTLEFLQPNGSATATIKTLQMNGWGSSITADDVYTYTNEFFDMARIAGEGDRKLLSDGDGGADWINAAAVSADVHVSLNAGQATTFDGVTAFTIARGTQIEHAVTGDGDDRLTGNRLDNRLYGMRGDDWLNGGAGNDTLFGGRGLDVFAFDTAGASGRDVVLDWTAGDRIATSKMLRGADANGLITLGANALVLLDGTAAGDTAEMSRHGGAVLKALGQQDGYWWYGYVSGGPADAQDGVIREAAVAGRVDAAAGAAQATLTADAAAPVAANDHAFYLYDTMGDAMASGVQLYA